MRTHPASFDRDEAIRFGWNQTFAQLRTVAGIVLISWAIGALQQMIQRGPGAGSLSAVLANLLLQAAQVAVTVGALTLYLRINDGQRPRVRDLADGLPLFFPFLLAQIVYALIVAGGLCLLIVPGILWAIRFGFFGFFIVDQKLDPIAALRKSWYLTKGRTRELFWFGLIVLGINCLGALALGVGLVITIPTTAIAAAHVYRRLLALAAEDAAAPVALTGPLAGAAP